MMDLMIYIQHLRREKRMKNNIQIKIEEAQKALSNMLDSQDKESVDKITAISKILDESKTESEKLIKEYDDMKSDYIQLVKNTKFPSPEKGDSMDTGEKSLEDIIADVIKKGK